GHESHQITDPPPDRAEDSRSEEPQQGLHGPTSRFSGSDDSPVDDGLRLSRDLIATRQAATRAPHRSQNRLSALNAAPQPAQQPASGTRARQAEKNGASISGGGPGVGHTVGAWRVAGDDAGAAAERRPFPLAGIMPSPSPSSSDDLSVRSASSAWVV